MGLYLNSKKPQDNYRETARTAYFVDKTLLLKELIPLVETDGEILRQTEAGSGNKYICITRPRRFGKTVMANMVAAYFGKGRSSSFFRQMKISSYELFERHLNQHNVIYITFNELSRNCDSYQQYIDRIQNRLLTDLIREYPDAPIQMEDAVWDALNTIYELKEAVKFVFVFDEWDFIFHRNFVTEKDKADYIGFLSSLLKDQPYVELAYMTGILPIAKYSSGSELNMFYEYTMVTEEKYCEYFGFTEAEVDKLYAEYIRITPAPSILREELRTWYNGYHTKLGERVYNPRSVVAALTNNNLGNYWTSSGPYDEIFYYIRKNVDDVRNELALMISGTPVHVKVREFAATSMNLSTKEEIFSAMVVYGFLSSENGMVMIPNKELMGQFENMLPKEPELGYIYRLAKESDRMLQATLAGDTDTVLQILEYAHNTETPLLNYSNEAELTAVINLVYLSARDSYRIEREEKVGTGYVDFIFYPNDCRGDCIILELKVDHTADEAIQQIKDRGYALRFQGKLGEKGRYTGRILAVGIAYSRADKKHCCKIEVL